tara:strand:- start:1625 stop:1834 length:210 start_codon:yes stop_codon:yes gene_type:complete
MKAKDLKFGQTIQYVDMANPSTKFKVLGTTSKFLYVRGLETNFLERMDLDKTFVENKSLTDGFNRWCLA